MQRFLLACLAAMVLVQASLAFPAQLEYILNDADSQHQAAVKRAANDEALSRVQRSQATCFINCLDCSRLLSAHFNTHSCMTSCKSATPKEDDKYTSCHRFYVSSK